MIIQPREKESRATRPDRSRLVRRAGPLLLLPALLLTGCFSNADRDNPLDPGSSLFEEIGTISGTVTTRFPPFPGIPGARVRIDSAGRSTTTDASGIFAFAGMAPGDYRLSVEADGFAPDSVIVRLVTNAGALVQIRLNGLPFFPSARAWSVHVSRWWPPDDLYALALAVDVDDPDGVADLDRVTFEIPALTLQDSLSEGAGAGRYEALMDAVDLPGGSLNGVVGHDIYFDAVDDSGAAARSDPVRMARVIGETPVATSPQGLESVGAMPELRWQTMAMPYPFTYTVEVFRIIAGVSTLVWRQEGVPEDQTLLTVADSLSTGDRFWTLTAVDEFGDTSRSREASFRVE